MGAKSSAGNFSENTDYERLEAGVYPARCIQVIELGHHKNTHPQAKSECKAELMIVFEVSGELMQDGRPYTVNWRGTNSLGEKAILRGLLKSWWCGRDFTEDELRGFELSKILDAPCMLNIAKEAGKKDTTKIYNKILGVMPLPKGMTVADRVNDLVDFGIDDRHNPELFAKIWPWVANIIKESYEAKGIPIPGQGEQKTTVKNEIEGDIPF